MTREQAIAAARQALAREHGSDHGLDSFGHQAESMVDALEALGLIKFEELPVVKTYSVPALSFDLSGGAAVIREDTMIETLRKAGYNIYRNGVLVV